MRYSLILAAVLMAAPAFAQVQSRPTDAPLVTAQNEAWYQQREPIDFAGELYFPAGAAVFFNGNSMVRTGHYNGVPLYADTTLEPYSVIFVPVSRGQMQPYERPRRGSLAGTSGSRTPSFPVASSSSVTPTFQAALAPTALPQPIGAISAYTPQTVVDRPLVLPTAIAPPLAPVVTSTEVSTVLRPENNDGIWVRFAGQKWVSAGAAISLGASGFTRVGEMSGFPVFRRQGSSEMIYLPTAEGLVAPYRLKP